MSNLPEFLIEGTAEGLLGAETDAEFSEALADMQKELARMMATKSKWTEAAPGLYQRIGGTIADLVPGIYEAMVTQQGTFLTRVRSRTDRLLVFPESPIDEVTGEIRTFWGSEQRFRDYGFPFKRGILLYGPPGSGKTSIVRTVVENVVDEGGIGLVFTGLSSFLAGYREIRHVQPKTPVVGIMEDIDAILVAGGERNQSQVLNLLDGGEALENVVFIATTNYIEKLEPRIYNRPSRFDRKILVPHPREGGRRVYLEWLMHGDEGIDIEKWIKDTDDLSLAHIKELFVSVVVLGKDYAKTIAQLSKMRESVKSVDDDPEFRNTRRGQYV